MLLHSCVSMVDGKYLLAKTESCVCVCITSSMIASLGLEGGRQGKGEGPYLP